DCYGGAVVTPPPAEYGLKMVPLLPIADKLSCPLLGLFGENDKFPSPEDTAQLEKVLTQHGKTFEFHTYPDAGHAFFSVDRPAYRVHAAVDGWQRVFTWFSRYLGN